jgi:hypothetical protein
MSSYEARWIEAVLAGTMTRRELIKRATATGLSAVAIGALLEACASSSPSGSSTGGTPPPGGGNIPGPRWQGGKYGRTLRVSYSDPIDGVTNLDSSNGGPPFAAYWAVNQLFYRGLMFFGSGETLTPLPDMADGFPTVSPDGLTYTTSCERASSSTTAVSVSRTTSCGHGTARSYPPPVAGSPAT